MHGPVVYWTRAPRAPPWIRLCIWWRSGGDSGGAAGGGGCGGGRGGGRGGRGGGRGGISRLRSLTQRNW